MQDSDTREDWKTQWKVSYKNKHFYSLPYCIKKELSADILLISRFILHDLYNTSLQSMQWIINAAYNQRSLQSKLLYTAWINHPIWGHIFGNTTFHTVITTSVIKDINEKIAGVDCMKCWLSVALKAFQEGIKICALDECGGVLSYATCCHPGVRKQGSQQVK
jgi:hypothetical protein